MLHKKFVSLFLPSSNAVFKSEIFSLKIRQTSKVIGATVDMIVNAFSRRRVSMFCSPIFDHTTCHAHIVAKTKAFKMIATVCRFNFLRF